MQKTAKTVAATVARERKWIEEAKRSPQAFRKLFDRHYNKIFNYALRRTGNVHLAQDVTANTFLHALEKINSFRWHGLSFSAWLYRIATNEINQAYRKEKRTVPLTPEISRQFTDHTTTDAALLQAEETLEKNAKYKKMHAALSKLDVKYQSVLTLRYYENKSMKEIAEILDLSENTVKTHIRRGLMRLRAVL